VVYVIIVSSKQSSIYGRVVFRSFAFVGSAELDMGQYDNKDRHLMDTEGHRWVPNTQYM
jgi:hypothetical protein